MTKQEEISLASVEYSRKYYANHRDEKMHTVNMHDKTDVARYGRLKSNAKKRGTDFNLDKLGFLIWFQDNEKVCYYCGIQLNTNGYRGEQLSVDRKDNSIGYEMDNIVLCCQRCNTIKGNIFTADEMAKIANEYIKPKLLREES